MKKIRILALILALLMLPISILVGCKKPDDDDTDPSECRHKWTKYTEISARDCVTPLVRERTCTKCGEKETDTKPAYGHSPGEAISDGNASCTEDGTKTRKCGRCDYSVTEIDVGSAKGHTFTTYTGVDGDEFVESAVCVECETYTDYRLLGLNIDFEGDKSHLSYTKFDTYFVEAGGAIETKVEGEGDNANAYLSIKRNDSVFAGNSAFGIVLTPRASMLKGPNTAAAPYYVVEFDVRISKTGTKDLILLSGTKKDVTENFIKYNSEDGTLVTAAGAVYSFKDSDYDRWVKISVVLNDGSKEYTVYVDGYQLTFDVDGEKATEIAYTTVDGYYLGYDVENFKIGLTAEVGVASEFDIDNIQHYLGNQPKEDVYKGSYDPEYFIYTTSNGDKIVYRIADENCEHIWGDTTVVEHTCISTGYKIHTCTLCGGQEIFDIATDNLGEHDFKEVTTIPATCTETAFRQEQCTKCGLKNGYAVGSPKGHEINKEAESTRVIDPTCTEKGYTVGFCIRCNIEYAVDYVDPLDHEIDYDNTDTYEIVEPDCLNVGYTIGHCKRCDVSNYRTDETEALGHLLNTQAEDYVKVEASCLTKGYEESTCGREGCSEKCRTNEVEANGQHVTISEIREIPVEGSTTEVKRVIHSECTRCSEVVSQRDLSTEVPNRDELVELIGAANMLGNTNSLLYHFDTKIGTTYGNDTQKNDSAGLGFCARYSKYVIKTDQYNFNSGYNGYMEWVYSPQNGKGTVADDSGDLQSYFDVTTGKTATGKDVTFEMSLRIPDGSTEVIPIKLQVLDRTYNRFTAFANVLKDGTVALVSGQKIAKLKQMDWTRLAFVFHTTNATYDVYVDGVMIEKGVMIEIVYGADTNSTQVLPVQSAFREINNSFRVTVADKTFAAGTRKLDVDEIFAYYSSVPAYVTDVKLNEKSGMSAFTESINTSDGSTYPYVSRYDLCDVDAQRYVDVVHGKNTRIFVDVNNGSALHLLKNSSVTSISNPVGNTAAYIDLKVGYTDITGEVNLKKLLYQYKSIVFETEFTINEGTGDFNLLRGHKNNMNTYSEVFLAYKAGNIVSGTDVIVSDVEIGRKYTVAVVMREDAFNYDIYIDGCLMRERVPYSNSLYCVKDIDRGLTLRAFYTTSNADILIHSVNVYGGKETPLLNLGHVKSEEVVSEGDCENDRVIKYFCSTCGWEYTVTTEVAPGHSWTSWETVTEATCADGLERRDCTACDEYEENVLPAVSEHDFGDELTEQPSTVSEGYTYYECSVCGHHEVLTTIPAIFEGTQDLEFVIKGNVAVIEKYTGTATDIVVPGTYAGKAVVIAKNSFSGNTTITSITLGEGITEIGISSFEGCTSLSTIVLPESIALIDMFAFKDCNALTTVNYAGAAKIEAGSEFKAEGNDAFFGATWNCNYEA